MSTEQKAFIADYSVLQVLNNVLENITKVSGIYGRDTYEIKTNYKETDSEVVIPGKNNCFIVLGRDRNAGVASGKGGVGTTGAGAIDLIAGHMGSRPLDTLFGEKVYSDKDFKNDSARVYISQKADIDSYLNIPEIKVKLGTRGINLESSISKSTVAAKADNIRLAARENIKLVTYHKGLNSQSKRSQDGGIDIIAGCNALAADKTLNLQPMVKGNNLLELLKKIIFIIQDVQSTVATFMETQKRINDTLANHVHQSSNAGLPTSQPVALDMSQLNYELLTRTLPDIIGNFINQASIDGTYFSPTSDKYIVSLWNRVN